MIDNKNKKKKRAPWIKKRHLVITNIAKALLYPYIKWKYGIKMEKFKEQGDRQYLILANHQTGFDQFFVAYAFEGAVYYIASEDIFSMGFISDLLRFAVNPIPIKKQTTDMSAVLNCLRVAREGGTIAIFPEGNRTYSGRTEYISPAIITLAKKLGLPIALMRIEGGYGVAPRWGDKVRRGRMRSYVSRVLEPEEYKNMSDGELAALIESELYVNEAKADGEYCGKSLAHYLERVIYYCPECNTFAPFESKDDIIECKSCGMQARYLPTKELCGVERELPYRFVADWYDAQSAFVNSVDTTKLCDEAIFFEGGELYEVVVYKNKLLLLDEAWIELFGDRFEISRSGKEYIFKFDGIRAITVCGKNKLNFYVGDKAYQLTGGARFNALKYVNLYHRYKNIKKQEKGEKYDEFLGL